MRLSVVLPLASLLAISLSAQIEVVSDGKVGIGTASPAQKLQVEAGTNRSVATYLPTGITGIADFSVGGVAWGLSRPSNGNLAHLIYTYDNAAGDNNLVVAARSDLVFTTGDGPHTAPERMRILDNGNVGIGTANPVTRLEVNGAVGGFPAVAGTAQANASLRITNSQTNGVLDIGVYSGSGAWLQYTHREDLSQAYPLLLNPNGGNVGIGTTSASVRLEVAGPAVASPLYQSEAVRTTSSSHSAGLGVDGSGTHWGTSLFQDGTKVFTVEANGGALIGSTYVAANAPANGLAVEGNVGIGTASPSHKLQVAGTVRATSFISDTGSGGYADFVFKSDYRLPPLSEVEAHIQAHGHLPGVPSEAQVAKEGIDLARMQVQLLQKVEELTLHLIQQEKKQQRLENENATLRVRLDRVESR